MNPKAFPVGLGLSERLYLPALLAAATWLCASCADPAPPPSRAPLAFDAGRVQLTLLEDRAQSWRLPLPASELRGLRLLYDTPLSAGPTLGAVHWIVRSNHRLDPFDALQLATAAVARARERGLDPGFFCATLLQESAFAPDAMSPAGAVGIAQFTLDTADGEGVDPFDWSDAMRGSANLLARYVQAYDGVYPDPYAAALAAYNAGPGAVDRYHGVPPYAETRAYVADIYDRWARIERDSQGPAPAERQQARR